MSGHTEPDNISINTSWRTGKITFYSKKKSNSLKINFFPKSNSNEHCYKKIIIKPDNISINTSWRTGKITFNSKKK